MRPTSEYPQSLCRRPQQRLARLIGRFRLHRPDVGGPTDSERKVPVRKEVIADRTVKPLPDIPRDLSNS